MSAVILGVVSAELNITLEGGLSRECRSETYILKHKSYFKTFPAKLYKKNSQRPGKKLLINTSVILKNNTWPVFNLYCDVELNREKFEVKHMEAGILRERP